MLKAGGIVGLGEGDFGTWLWEPSSPLLKRVQEIAIKSYMQLEGSNPFLGRHCRRLLLEAGFSRAEAHGRASSDCAGTLAETRRIAAKATGILADGQFVRAAVDRGWATADELKAMAAEVRAWGERPDAFYALLNCAAVGWV